MAGEYQPILAALLNEPDNKICVDCAAPAPQWASVSYGIFFCLNCSGSHRSLGVHLSFVRSVSLDKWSESQVQKMKLGGNGKWKKWCAEHGAAENYSSEMGIPVLYNTHFAAQYRDKLSAEAEGRSWSPSDTPPVLVLPGGADASGALRKPRSQQISRAGSASSRAGSPQTASPAATMKAENESYFSSLGSLNASRPDNIPPSQGGKYVGFGSAATSPGAGAREDGWSDAPAVLSKGWGFLSSTLSQATQTLNEHVVRPAQEKAADPELQSQVWSLANRLQQTVLEATKAGSGFAAEGLKVASEQARARGYDLGGLGSSQLENFSKSDRPSGDYSPINDYSELSLHAEEEDGDGDGDGHAHAEDLGAHYTAVPNQAPNEEANDWAQLAPLTAARQKNNSAVEKKTKKAAAAPQKISEDTWDEW